MESISKRSDSNGSSDTVKPAKIKIACLSCRKRKSKCDGNPVCSTCKYYGKTCEYPPIEPKKKRGKGKTNNRKEIGNINERLTALENILMKLSNHLDARVNFTPQSQSSTDPIYRSNSNETTATEETTVSTDTNDSHHGFENSSSEVRTSSEARTSTDITHKSGPEQPTENGNKKEKKDKHWFCHLTFNQTFGSNWALGILSKDSISWLKSKFDNESILLPLNRIPMFMDCLMNYSFKYWADPQHKRSIDQYGQHGYFSISHELAIDIIDAYGKDCALYTYFVDANVVKGLFNLYYNDHKHRFKYSELILMNIYLSLCLRNRVDAKSDKIVRSRFKYLSQLTEDALYELQESTFMNSICYYGQVCMINEGITTLQCLALMIGYVSCTFSTDFQIVAMLSSLLVTYSQDLGLNRLLYHSDLPVEGEHVYCKRLWWYCQMIDIKSCYKTGKTPMINIHDLASIDALTAEFERTGLPLAQNGYIPKPSLGLPNYNDMIFHYLVYFQLRLKRIERESYEELFSFRAHKENNNMSLFYERLDEFNESLDELCALIDPSIRPLLPHQRIISAQQQVDTRRPMSYDDFMVYLLKFNYYTHYSFINRTPVLQQNHRISRNDSKLQHYTSISNCCAREIVKITNSIDVKSLTKLMIGEMLDYTITGFMSVLSNCLSNPQDPQIMDDCDSLVACATNFFYSNKTVDYMEDFVDILNHEEKIGICDLFVRILLRVLLEFLSKHLKSDLIKYYSLGEYFKSIETLLPQLFEDMNKADGLATTNHADNVSSKYSTATTIATQKLQKLKQSRIFACLTGLQDVKNVSEIHYSAFIFNHMVNLPCIFQDNET